MAKKPKPSPERLTRPKLGRTAPNRAVIDLLSGKASARPEPAPFGATSTGATGVGSDAAKRGVEMGYRVIDEYVKKGATAANAFSSPSRVRPASEQDLSKMTERMMQYASDFTSLWYDAMGMMMGNMNAQGQPSGESVSGAPSADAPGVILGHSRIVLEIKSNRPVEIIVALDAPHHAGSLLVEELKTRTGGAGITGAKVEASPEAQGPLKVRVQVGKGIAPGRYTGAILDAASAKPQGRLTVTVGK